MAALLLDREGEAERALVVEGASPPDQLLVAHSDDLGGERRMCPAVIRRRDDVAFRLRENGAMTSYPTPEFRRPALAPGILGAIVLIAGLVLLDNPGGYLFIKFGVAILALIMCVFSWQSGQWWWIIGLAAIAVAWNPIWPFALNGQIWVASQFVAALLFVVTGLQVKVVNPEDRNRPKAGARR